uniref:Uncharacterized protein n=1 Tax=Opuntia streptacantha TaxID=393608 RepID=A0A7C9ARB5_OPUST
MHMINNKQCRRPNNQNPDQSPSSWIQFLGNPINGKMQNQIRNHNSDSLEVNHGIGLVIEALMKINDRGVDVRGEKREEELEVGEERGVIEGPLTGGVGIPLRERKRVGCCEPIAMDLEVGAVVRWDEEQFDCGGNEGKPQEFFDGVIGI